MRRIAKLGALLGGTIMTLALTALPALAAYPPVGPKEASIVRGPEAVATEVAFTGRDLVLLATLAVGFLVVGVVAMAAARRRAAAAAA